MIQKVIIVGNSNNLLQHKHGDIINSFDYVVRLGECTTTRYEKHVGTKTDLLCTLVNYFLSIHYHDNKIEFRPRLFVKNCKHILFLEHDCDIYKEFTPHGDLWGVNYIHPTSTAAGNRYFKFFYADRFHDFFTAKKYSERVIFDFMAEALHTVYGVEKISFYDKVDRVKSFMLYNKQLAHNNIYMPSKGMYILDYVIKTFPNAEIFVTGFDGMKTKNYWRKNNTPFWASHSSSHEMLMYKKLLRTGRIQEL
jgi:hypothetical protein